MSDFAAQLAELGRTFREIWTDFTEKARPIVREVLAPAIITGSVRLKFHGRDRRRIKRELRKAHDRYRRGLRS